MSYVPSHPIPLSLLSPLTVPLPPLRTDIPLTATLTYNGKSAKVQIVDRCEGCAVEDIDVTPAVFEYLTGNMALGRLTSGATNFEWSFDQY